MPEIVPFRGLLFDASKASPERCWAPPYDVISPQDRERLAAQDPHNVVRLILPKDDHGGDSDGRYAHAALILRAWIGDGVLRRDEEPAYYRYHQTFTAAGKTTTRKGFICRMRLHRFSEGIVLPHERTLSGPKADRLKLTRATECQLSQVFGMYSDPERKSDAPFVAVERQKPDQEGTTSDGVLQKLWRLTEPAAIAEIGRIVAERKVYIADGHHRYETMLAYRDEARAAGRTAPHAATEFVTTFLCNMDDPGLIVLPTHRVIRGLAKLDWADLLARARTWFTVEEATRPETEALRTELGRRGESAPSFALLSGAKFAWLTVRRDVDLASHGVLAGPAVLQTLDVSLLHALLIENLLGIDRAAQEQQTNLTYVKALEAAIDEAGKPENQLVVVMNPTKVSEVRAVADAGEVMPQKSTFFYPKLASGLVMNPVGRSGGDV